jgi:hypothetical protein
MVLVAGDAWSRTRLLSEFSDQVRQLGMHVFMGASVGLADIGLAYLPVVRLSPRPCR